MGRKKDEIRNRRSVGTDDAWGNIIFAIIVSPRMPPIPPASSSR
jgi:hypothetical protein